MYPVVISGDFNDVPQSDSIQEVMQQEFIDLYTLKNIDPEWKSEIPSVEEVENYGNKILEYKVGETQGDYPEFTTFKYRKKDGYVKRTIDYMFVSKEEASRIKVLKWLAGPREDQLD